MIRKHLFIALFSGCLAVSLTRADDAPTTQPQADTAQPATRHSELLGAKFSSHLYGIEFYPPANCTEIHKPTPDTIVEFIQDEYNWRLQVSLVRLEKSIPLTIHNDQFGQKTDGLLEMTLDNIRRGTPGVSVLRNEVINAGRINIGMIAVRYFGPGHQRLLTQQALVEVPGVDNRLYYFFDLTVPGKPEAEPDEIINPAELLASKTFSQVIDSINLLDRTNLVEDQRQRLYSTRSLFVLWDSDHFHAIHAALIPEQWTRIVKDNVDVGYSYTVQKLDENNKMPDQAVLRIGTRTHLKTSPTEQWDFQTWVNSTVDRTHESWTTSARCTNVKGEELDNFTQVGSSDEQTKAVPLENKSKGNGLLNLPDAQDNGPLGQGNVDIETVRSLEILTTHNKAKLTPMRQDVPVFYIPQAFSSILPNLLPLNRPHAYMFATFVTNAPASAGVISARYTDVLAPQTVHFNGQDCQAVPVNDKIGLDGPVTTYYFTPDGKFIGATCTTVEDNKPSTQTMVATDAPTLQRLWDHPDLTISK